MPITNHVTSLELSRRLKELNVPQTTMFWWTEWGTDEDVCDEESIEFHKRSDYPRVVFCHTQSPKHGVPPKSIITSAYLASELGEFIGNALENGDDKDLPEELQPTTFQDIWNPDYLAKLLIWLLENHLISVEELGK